MKVSEEFMIDVNKASQADLEEALLLLAKKKERKAKIERGEIKAPKTKSWSELSEEEKEKRRGFEKKRRVKMALLAKKAEAAGITVSEDEILDFMTQ